MNKQEVIPLFLKWFSKTDDYLIDTEACCINLDKALSLVETDPDYDPNFSCSYAVDQKIAERIQKYYKHPIDLDQYDYSLCCYSDYRCSEDGVVEKI